MKSNLFGNPQTEWWKLKLVDVHPREQVVELTGELHAGFFSAVTPMCLPPTALESFASELRTVDRTLHGSATLRNSNEQSDVIWNLTDLPRGHIESSGRYAINGNGLDFRFRSDQTQLGPLARWIETLLGKYREVGTA